MLGSLARFVAFCLFVSAAFDWPTVFVDRAGTAALALAFLSLGVGGRTRASIPYGIPPKMAQLRDPNREAAEMADLMRYMQAAAAAQGEDGRSGEGSSEAPDREAWRRESAEY